MENSIQRKGYRKTYMTHETKYLNLFTNSVTWHSWKLTSKGMLRGGIQKQNNREYESIQKRRDETLETRVLNKHWKHTSSWRLLLGDKIKKNKILWRMPEVLKSQGGPRSSWGPIVNSRWWPNRWFSNDFLPKWCCEGTEQTPQSFEGLSGQLLPFQVEEGCGEERVVIEGRR